MLWVVTHRHGAEKTFYVVESLNKPTYERMVEIVGEEYTPGDWLSLHWAIDASNLQRRLYHESL